MTKSAFHWLWLLVLATVPALAQDDPYDPATAVGESAQPLVDAAGSQIFFDARQTGMSRDMKEQVFEGDVVAIGAGVMIAADEIKFDRAKNRLDAKGHIVLMGTRQVFTGSAITYHIATTDFVITDAVMLINDSAATDKVTGRLLGFTPRELQYEKARQARLKDVLEHKSRLRDEARRQAREGAPLSPDLVDRYARLLDQEELMKAQENPSLAHLDEDRRESFKRRRLFWEQSRKSGLSLSSGVLAKAYLRIEGSEIVRTEGNDYVARNALFTPCYCDEDSSPAWAFRADEVEAQIGGYADLSHPVLEIKGIPVLYLPYLKLPIKDQRQSGFLMPTFGFQKRSGNLFSQPVYFDLGKDADATLTTDMFENRGTRVGVEYRTQNRAESGWDLRLEGIRDRLWIADRGVREDLLPLYRAGLADAAPVTPPGDGLPVRAAYGSEREYTRAVLQDPDYWNAAYGGRFGDGRAADDVEALLAVPNNTWRGSYSWRGVTYFAPRLSLVSNAEILSDHRYTEELYVPDDFREALFGGRDAKAFSPARAQFHLDGTDFYAGVGMRYGDNYLLSERFEGQQMPLTFTTQSRLLSLTPAGSILPIYGQMSGENVRITEFKNSAAEDGGTGPVTLGDGNWRRVKLDTVSPLVTDGIFQLSHYSNFEGRYVETSGLPERRSEIRSWSTALEVSLPIDGKGELPASMQEDCQPVGTTGVGPLVPATESRSTGDDTAFEDAALPECPPPESAKQRYVHHLMDWRLRFSVRPSVVRRGPYQDPTVEGGNLAYFASDYGRIRDTDTDVPDVDRMQEHRRITFLTSHAWKLFNRGWEVVPGSAAKEERATPPDAESVAERARRELLYNLDRPVGGDADLYDETNNRWLVDRYVLTDSDYTTPLTLKGEVTYDFLDQERREEDLAHNREVEALLPPFDARIADLNAQIAAARAADPNADVSQLEADRDTEVDARAKVAGKRRQAAEPWKDPTVEMTARYAGWVYTTSVAYSVYAKTARELDMFLQLPRLYSTNISFGYSQSKRINLLQQTFARTRERRVSLATSLIPPVTSFIQVRRQLIDDEVPTFENSVRTAYGFDYQSSSRCWGLQFSREKDYGDTQAEATYLLRLSVIFMGQERSLPNMSAGLVREVRGEEEDVQ